MGGQIPLRAISLVFAWNLAVGIVCCKLVSGKQFPVTGRFAGKTALFNLSVYSPLHKCKECGSYDRGRMSCDSRLQSREIQGPKQGIRRGGTGQSVTVSRFEPYLSGAVHVVR